MLQDVYSLEPFQYSSLCKSEQELLIVGCIEALFFDDGIDILWYFC